jgi:hypothetical protein
MFALYHLYRCRRRRVPDGGDAARCLLPTDLHVVLLPHGEMMFHLLPKEVFRYAIKLPDVNQQMTAAAAAP